jgi:hypothetical protein
MVSVEPLCQLLFDNNDYALYCADQYCSNCINSGNYALIIVVGILLLQMLVLFWQHRKLKKSVGLKSNAQILKERIQKGMKEK